MYSEMTTQSVLSPEADIFVPNKSSQGLPLNGTKAHKPRPIPRYMISCYPFVKDPSASANGFEECPPQTATSVNPNIGSKPSQKLVESFQDKHSFPNNNLLPSNLQSLFITSSFPASPSSFPASPLVPPLLSPPNTWFDVPRSQLLNRFHAPQNGFILPTFPPPNVPPPARIWGGRSSSSPGPQTASFQSSQGRPSILSQVNDVAMSSSNNPAIVQTKPTLLRNGINTSIIDRTVIRFEVSTQTDLPAEVVSHTLQLLPSPLYVQPTDDHINREFSQNMHQLSLQQHRALLPHNTTSRGTDSMLSESPSKPRDCPIEISNLKPSDVLANLPVAYNDNRMNIHETPNLIGSILLHSRQLSGESLHNELSHTCTDTISEVPSDAHYPKQTTDKDTTDKKREKIRYKSSENRPNRIEDAWNNAREITAKNWRPNRKVKKSHDSIADNRTSPRQRSSAADDESSCGVGIHSESSSVTLKRNDFPELSSSNVTGSCNAAENLPEIISSYSDVLRGSFRSDHDPAVTSQDLTLDLSTENRVSQKWRKRRERANRAAVHELAEISLEQQVLMEMKNKTQSPSVSPRSQPINRPVTPSQPINKLVTSPSLNWPALTSPANRNSFTYQTNSVPIRNAVTTQAWAVQQSQVMKTSISSQGWPTLSSQPTKVTTQAWNFTPPQPIKNTATSEQTSGRNVTPEPIQWPVAMPEPIKSPEHKLEFKGIIPMKVIKKQSTKKSQQPVTFDISEMLDAIQNKKTEPKVEPTQSRPEKVAVSHNPLDSSAPTQKRGKERESPKSKKPSPLKKVILKEREEKRRMRDEIDEATEAEVPKAAVGVGVIPESDLSQDTAPGTKYEGLPTPGATDLSPISQTSPVSFSPFSSGVNSPIGSAYARGMMNVMSMKIHSRRFREYCKQILDKDIDSTCTNLLQDLVRFQDRAINKDPMKAKSKRRIVLGLREVTKHLKLRKIKCVIISPNLEKIQSKGGLDDALNKIIELCSDQTIPFVFALGRRALGWACGKMVPVSVVGMFNYGGSDENFKRLMELTAKAQEAYTEMLALLEREANDAPPKTAIFAHMGHSRTPSACSAISFTSSILSEPISENYPHSEPETDSRGNEIVKSENSVHILRDNGNVPGVKNEVGSLGSVYADINSSSSAKQSSLLRSGETGSCINKGVSDITRSSKFHSKQGTGNNSNIIANKESGDLNIWVRGTDNKPSDRTNKPAKSVKNVCFEDTKPPKKIAQSGRLPKVSFCDIDDGNEADVEDLDETEISTEKTRRDFTTEKFGDDHAKHREVPEGCRDDDVLVDLPHIDAAHWHDSCMEILSQLSTKTCDTTEGTLSTAPSSRTIQESLGSASIVATLGSNSFCDERKNPGVAEDGTGEAHRVKHIDKERIDTWVAQAALSHGGAVSDDDNRGDSPGDTDSYSPSNSDPEDV